MLISQQAPNQLGVDQDLRRRHPRNRQLTPPTKPRDRAPNGPDSGAGEALQRNTAQARSINDQRKPNGKAEPKQRAANEERAEPFAEATLPLPSPRSTSNSNP
jgi:hypothetical protein